MRLFETIRYICAEIVSAQLENKWVLWQFEGVADVIVLVRRVRGGRGCEKRLFILYSVVFLELVIGWGTCRARERRRFGIDRILRRV